VILLIDAAGKLLNLIEYEGLLDPAVLWKLRYYRRIRNVLEFVATHESDDIRLKDAAKIAMMQHAAFSRYFSTKTGVSFLTFVRAARIAKALIMITTDDYAVADLAEKLGFRSTATFVRTFKQMVGCSPSTYRRRWIESPTFASNMKLHASIAAETPTG
jgi:AraC-like DNA-binding protein